MSWTNPFANTGGSGLTEGQVQGVIDTLSISPVYTNQSTAQTNLTNYEIVRVNLSSDTITLPSGSDGMHIRILNTKVGDLEVKDQSGTTISTIYQELVSFYYLTNTWIVFTSY
jgi:hypothetical protein